MLYSLSLDKYPRVKKFAGQGGQVWNDQQVVVDDSFERCSGYEYFGIIDFDEFFVPAKKETLRETLVSCSCPKTLIKQNNLTSTPDMDI